MDLGSKFQLSATARLGVPLFPILFIPVKILEFWSYWSYSKLVLLLKTEVFQTLISIEIVTTPELDIFFGEAH